MYVIASLTQVYVITSVMQLYAIATLTPTWRNVESAVDIVGCKKTSPLFLEYTVFLLLFRDNTRRDRQDNTGEFKDSLLSRLFKDDCIQRFDFQEASSRIVVF